MENGNVFRARVFIDASYEGDLMAKANVTYTFGREANALYNETLNGVRANTPAHQFLVDVDPYQTPGNPDSGLLPYIQPGDGGVFGEGDQRIQAYNFRLCLTQNTSNQVAVTAPANYEEANYELLARYIEARVAAGHTLNVRSFMNIGSMPNGKTDINNNGAFSTDFIGQNYEYPEGSYARREEIFDATLNYIQGFLYFLGNSPRVPEALRLEMLSWGLTRDEFQDDGGWPHQMYVREARRMVSDYVMTEHNCRGTTNAPKSIGLASYTMDSHNCQRIVQGGVARNEGDFQSPVGAPYPIGYDSIVPARGECENLLVPFC
ncbi:MAG: FAD-dependent oxidoreductase, partial [Gammaproteobacteria bacterium]